MARTNWLKRTGLGVGLALVCAGAAAAEDYRMVGWTDDSQTWVDKDSVAVGPSGIKNAWGVLVYRDHSQDVVYVRFRAEFDCASGQSRYVEISFFDKTRTSNGTVTDPTPWQKPPAKSVNDGLNQQVCSGVFDPASNGRLSDLLDRQL